MEKIGGEDNGRGNKGKVQNHLKNVILDGKVAALEFMEVMSNKIYFGGIY